MSFSNPILAGEELIRSAIRSEDYVANVSGWRIARNGDAEFNSIVARGQIESVGVTETARLTAGSLVIELNSNPVTLSRLTRNTLEFQDGVTNEKANLEFEAGIPLIGFSAPITTSRTVYFHGDKGFLVSGTDVFSPAVEDWNNLPLAGAWAVDVETPQYKLMPDGTVAFRGNMTGGATANGTTIANVPAGYRPPTNQRFITAEKQTGLAWRHVAIDTAGVMRVWNATTAHICLDGVRYPIV